MSSQHPKYNAEQPMAEGCTRQGSDAFYPGKQRTARQIACAVLVPPRIEFRPGGTTLVLEIPFLEPKNEQGSVVVDEAARKLYNEVLPSVVEIQARTNAGRGIGSGFFIDQERVVTNQHVVAGKDRVNIIYGGTSYPARIERLDDINDLAVLKVQGLPADLKHGILQIRSSQALSNKDRLYLMGHPEGVSQTVMSFGPYSQRGSLESFVIFPQMGFWPKLTADRSSTDIDIRKDAEGVAQSPRILSLTPIRGGNSGGPLVDSKGQLVGIVANGNEKQGRQALSVPSETLQALLAGPSKFEFTYDTKSRMGLDPVVTMGSLTIASGLALKIPRVGIPAVGAFAVFDSISNTSELLQAHDSFQWRCSALGLTSDALIIGGAVATFFPKARPIGYAAYSLGLGGILAESLIPRYDSLVEVKRVGGGTRLPYAWKE